MGDAHARRLLARSPGCRIEACRCGHVLLHFGAHSVRMPAERLAEFARTLGEASASFVPIPGGARALGDPRCN